MRVSGSVVDISSPLSVPSSCLTTLALNHLTGRCGKRHKTCTEAPTSGAERARTTIRARSARNRSCERSNGRPSASHAVRAAEQARLGAAGGDDLDALLRLSRLERVLGLEELVQRARERAVEQAGEPVGGEGRPLERDRVAVGEADAHDLEHDIA